MGRELRVQRTTIRYKGYEGFGFETGWYILEELLLRIDLGSERVRNS